MKTQNMVVQRYTVPDPLCNPMGVYLLLTGEVFP